MDLLRSRAEDLGIAVLGKTAAELKVAVLAAMEAQGLISVDVDPPTLARVQQALLNADRLLAAHRTGPTRAAVVYFRAEDNDCADISGMLRAVTSGAIEQIAVTDRHVDLCLPKPAAFIGTHINSYLKPVLSQFDSVSDGGGFMKHWFLNAV